TQYSQPSFYIFFFQYPATTQIYTLSLHDALPIFRIHQPDVQKTVFEDVLQIPPEETKLRFGYMLDAFRFGAPPHGGIALGFDRLIAMLCGTPSIRDVIAFPKTAKGVCLMTETPTPVSPRQLRDLHIELKKAPPS